MRLGHLRLDVEDLDRQVAFYTAALGLTVRERVEADGVRYAFLTDGVPVPGHPDGMHHRLVLRASDATLGETTRLDHMAWEVDDERALWDAVERLRALDAPTDLQDARIAWQCYSRDPEGIRLEVYCDRRDRPDGDPLWKGRQSRLAEARLRVAASAAR